MVTPSSDPMITIWEAISKKSPDGNDYIRWVGVNDLQYLYDTGFVDTDAYTLHEWIASFKACIRDDGSYLVSKEEWLEKRRYRYGGPVAAPLDPQQVKEGEWPADEFEKWVNEEVIPSTSIDSEKLWEMMKKNPKLFLGDRYKIGVRFKADLQQILDLSPSPRRRRELMVAEARKKIFPKAKAEAIPPPQRSAFTTDRPAGQVAADQLAKILGKKR